MHRVLDLVSLAVALAFALPISLFGAELLVGGDPFGLVYVGLAAALLLGQHLLTTPDDVPKRAAQWAVGRLVRREK